MSRAAKIWRFKIWRFFLLRQLPLLHLPDLTHPLKSLEDVCRPPPPPPSQDTPHSVNSWEIFWLKAQPIRLSCCCGCCLEESVIPTLKHYLSAIKKIKIRTLILTKGKITLDVGDLEFKCYVSVWNWPESSFILKVWWPIWQTQSLVLCLWDSLTIREGWHIICVEESTAFR